MTLKLQSGKHDWLFLYFLILPIISNTQTHHDHQQRIQKLRSDKHTGLPKGQTVRLIQLDSVTGQGSSFATERIPIAQFFLSYREQIKDLHSSTWITARGREKMKCEFQPWVHVVFPVLPVDAALMKVRNPHVALCITVPPKRYKSSRSNSHGSLPPSSIYFFMGKIG